METVEEFNKELLSISSTKPPISKAKITGIVRLALKATHYYKYVVQSVEKYIWKCKPQYKLPGLYVIDAIIHQARLQFKYKDVYAPRFGRNLYRTFNYVFQCPDEDRKKVLRVLNLWSLNDFFKDDVLKPIFELAEQIEKKKQEDAEAEEGEKKSEREDSDNEEEGNKKDTSLDEDAGGMSKDLLLQLASLQSSLSNQNMGDLLNSMQDSSSTANSLTKGIEFLLSNPNLIKQLGELQTKFSLNQIKDLENIVESTLVGAGGATTTTTTTTAAEPVVVRPSTPPHPEPVEMKKTHTGGTIAPQLLAEESEFEKFLQENEQRSASQRSAAAQPRVNEVVDLRSPDQHHQDMDLRSIHLPQQQSGNSRTEDATKHISTNFNLDDICLPSNLNEINLPPPPPQTSAPPPLPPLPTDLTSDLPMNLPLPPSSSAPPAPMMYHHHNNEHHGNEHHRGGNAMPNFSVPPPSLPPPHAWMMSEPPPPLPLPPHYSQQQDMEMSQEMMDVSRSDETTRGEMFPPRVASNKSASRSPSHRTGKRRSQSPRDRKRSRSREGSSRRKRRNRSRSRDRRRGSSRERRRGGRSPRRSPSDRYGSRGGKGRSRSRDRKRGRRSESPRGRFGDRERAGSREVTRNSRESSVRKAGSKESRAGSREVSVGRAGRTEGRSRDVSKDRERGRSERRSRERSKDRENKAATTTGGDWSRSSRERSGDGDDERDKERRDKGFPCPKKDHISICSKTIWVGHLPKTMEEAELRSMFNEYGDIAVFNLIPPRGCAFVTLTERSAAANALRGLRRAKLGGKSLSLDWAPGKNCKDGQYRDYWNVEQGVTYLPYSCIESTNFESLIEGCSFDLSTVPEFLRSRLEMIQASYEARVLLSGQGQNQGGAPPPDHWAPVPQQPMGGAPPGFFPPGGPQGPPPGWFPPGGPGGPPMMPPMGIRLPPPPAGMQQNGGPPMGGPGGPPMGGPGGPPMGGPGGPPMGGPGGPFMGGPGGPPRPLFRPFTIGGPMGPRHHMRGPPPIFDGPRGPPPPRGFHNGGMRLRPPGLGLYDDEDDVEIQRENEDEQFPRRSSREGSGEMDRRSEGEEEEEEE